MKRICGEVCRVASEATLRGRRDYAEKINLKPALLVLNVRSHEVFVRLGQINDAFDDAENTREPASDHAEHELDNALGRVSQNELVHAEPANENRTNPGRDLLVRTQRFPVGHG